MEMHNIVGEDWELYWLYNRYIMRLFVNYVLERMKT
jgi:hypothetical protein